MEARFFSFSSRLLDLAVGGVGCDVSPDVDRVSVSVSYPRIVVMHDFFFFHPKKVDVNQLRKHRRVWQEKWDGVRGSEGQLLACGRDVA